MTRRLAFSALLLAGALAPAAASASIPAFEDAMPPSLSFALPAADAPAREAASVDSSFGPKTRVRGFDLAAHCAIGGAQGLTCGTRRASGFVYDERASDISVFGGYVWSKSTGLYLAGSGVRWYDPASARFTTADSFLGKIDSPPSLHRYTFGNDNPTRYVDLTGYAAGDVQPGDHVLSGFDKETGDPLFNVVSSQNSEVIAYPSDADLDNQLRRGQITPGEALLATTRNQLQPFTEASDWDKSNTRLRIEAGVRSVGNEATAPFQMMMAGAYRNDPNMMARGAVGHIGTAAAGVGIGKLFGWAADYATTEAWWNPTLWPAKPSLNPGVSPMTPLGLHGYGAPSGAPGPAISTWMPDQYMLSPEYQLRRPIQFLVPEEGISGGSQGTEAASGQLSINFGPDEAHSLAEYANYREALARLELSEQLSWKPNTAHGSELSHHAYSRHPSLATNERGVIDMSLYDARARAVIASPTSEIHDLGGGRYGAFNPETGEFSVFSWQGGGGLPAGAPTIHTFYIPLRNEMMTGVPFTSRGTVNLLNIRP